MLAGLGPLPFFFFISLRGEPCLQTLFATRRRNHGEPGDEPLERRPGDGEGVGSARASLAGVLV